jgi:hypothetical protein
VSDVATRRRELEELDLQYAKVCKWYKKHKAKETLKRETNDAYVYGAYGYPMYYPMTVYVTYHADPSACEHAQAGSDGSAGGCATGTYCESTSLRACVGDAGVCSELWRAWRCGWGVWVVW